MEIYEFENRGKKIKNLRSFWTSRIPKQKTKWIVIGNKTNVRVVSFEKISLFWNSLQTIKKSGTKFEMRKKPERVLFNDCEVFDRDFSGQIRLVASQMFESGGRDESILSALFRIFGLSNFRPLEQKQTFLRRILQYNFSVVNWNLHGRNPDRKRNKTCFETRDDSNVFLQLSILQCLKYQKFFQSTKFFSSKPSSTSKQFWVDNQVERIEPVATDKHEWKDDIFNIVFWNFRNVTILMHV